MDNHSEKILDALPSGLVLIGSDNRILQTNKAFVTLFPHANEGSDIRSVFEHTAISEENRKRLLEIIETQKADYADILGRQFVVSCLPTASPQEKLITLRDITTNEETQRLGDATLAMVAHELRTPLAAIRGDAELAIQDPQNALANLTRIITNAQRLLIMVENLLNRARLQTGRLVNRSSMTKIETIFNIVHSLMSFDAKEKGLEISIVIEENVPELVELDKVLLQEILTNLVSNAIKNTGKGEVTLRAFVHENRLGFSVKDTGRGIAASKRDLIFTEFQPDMSEEIPNQQRGTGIGLSIVQGLVHQMGGTLTLQSEEGRGSEFIVTFPLVILGSTRRKNAK
jgi:signal transduction histidine kinase